MIKMTIRQHYNFKNAPPFWCFHISSQIHNFLVSLVLNFLCIDKWQNLRISPIDLFRFPCFGFHEFWFIYKKFLHFVVLKWTYVIITFIYNICICKILIIIFFSNSSFCFIFLKYFFLALFSLLLGLHMIKKTNLCNGCKEFKLLKTPHATCLLKPLHLLLMVFVEECCILHQIGVSRQLREVTSILFQMACKKYRVKLIGNTYNLLFI
jgi:hypothetical protein